MWIKQVGCDCPDCGADECDPGCACTFGDTFTTTTGFEGTTGDVWDVTGQFIIEQDLQIICGNTGATRQVIVEANGVSIYDSGSTTGGISTIVAVPAGTTTLELILIVTNEFSDQSTQVELNCLG
jgi:hypothetical protein